MNSQVYLDNLDLQLLDTIGRQSLDEAQVLFKHNNDPQHKAHIWSSATMVGQARLFHVEVAK